MFEKCIDRKKYPIGNQKKKRKNLHKKKEQSKLRLRLYREISGEKGRKLFVCFFKLYVQIIWQLKLINKSVFTCQNVNNIKKEKERMKKMGIEYIHSVCVFMQGMYRIPRNGKGHHFLSFVMIYLHHIYMRSFFLF